MSGTVMQLSHGATLVVTADLARGLVRVTCIENNHAASGHLTYWDVVDLCNALADVADEARVGGDESSAREWIPNQMRTAPDRQL